MQKNSTVFQTGFLEKRKLIQSEKDFHDYYYQIASTINKIMYNENKRCTKYKKNHDEHPSREPFENNKNRSLEF